MPNVKTVKESPLFRALTEKEIREFLQFGQYQFVKKGDYIIHARENKHSLFIVLSGQLTAEIPGSENVSYSNPDFFGEIAFVNEHYRAASVIAEQDSELMSFDHSLLHNQETNSTILKKILINVVNRISSYLRTNSNTSSRLLIQNGEDEKVEFKSSLRYNLHTGKFDKNIEQASLKTIAAFLNSEGGTLLVGVEDDGNIFGLEKDQFANEDKAMLHLSNLVKTKISMHHLTFLKIHIEEMDGKDIMRVDVNPANLPAYYSGNNDEIFYIRTGPSTSQLRVSELYTYIQKRFS